MYLKIHIDGEMAQVDILTPELFQANYDGLCDLFRLNDGKFEYLEALGTWKTVPLEETT